MPEQKQPVAGMARLSINPNRGQESIGAREAIMGITYASHIKVITDILIDDLLHHPDHPFTPGSEEGILSLAEDMQVLGQLQPILVRLHPSEAGRYELLSGYRRTAAAKILEWPAIQAKVLKVNDDEAKLILVSSNLEQRLNLPPSERAKAIKIQLEALKALGKNEDKTEIMNADFAHVLAETLSVSRASVYRYLRIAELNSHLMVLLDDGRINIKAAAELSYLSNPEQEDVAIYIEGKGEEYTLSDELAQNLRNASGSDDFLVLILDEGVPLDTPPTRIKETSSTPTLRKIGQETMLQVRDTAKQLKLSKSDKSLLEEEIFEAMKQAREEILKKYLDAKNGS